MTRWPGLLCAAALAFATAVAGAQEKRIALIVGNDAYKTLPKLNNAAADARAIEARLKALGWETVVRINASKREMHRALDDFGNKLQATDGAGLFYYAGHGVQAEGRNYLVPVDAELETAADLKSDAVDAHLVTQAMDDTRNRVNIVILDACRDNPLPNRGRSATRGLAVAEKSPGGPRGAVVVYAAAPNQQAQDGAAGGNGVFTGAFVKALSGPDLKIEDVFKRVSAEVKAATGGKQVPWITSSLQGDFYFGAPPPAAPPPVAAAPTQDVGSAQVAFWNSIAASDDPRMFEEYLRQYPNGRFVGLAKLKIEALSKKPPAQQVAALPTPKTLDIEPIDREFIAIGATRVREAPDLKSKQLAALKEGDKILVLGKVKGADWLQVETAGAQGYVPRSGFEDFGAFQARKQKEADAAAERQRKAEEAARQEAARKADDAIRQDAARKAAETVALEQARKTAAEKAMAEEQARKIAEERVAAEKAAAEAAEKKRAEEEQQRLAAVVAPPSAAAPSTHPEIWEARGMRLTGADPSARNCDQTRVSLKIIGNWVSGEALTGNGNFNFQGGVSPNGEVRTQFRMPGAHQSVLIGTLPNLLFTGRSCVGQMTFSKKASSG